MDIFNELSFFDIFLHMDLLEIFNFNRLKVKTTLSNMRGNNCRKFLPLDFEIITILDDQLYRQKMEL